MNIHFFLYYNKCLVTDEDISKYVLFLLQMNKNGFKGTFAHGVYVLTLTDKFKKNVVI